MAAAIFRAKFAVPSLPSQFLARQRLDAVWTQPDCRVITVTAGAGWGKTDFLAEHARKVGSGVLWYTLDDLDRDPDVLIAHLASACGLPPSSAPPLEQLAAIITHLDEYGLLVLDDVHSISQAHAAREVMSRLLRYLPAGCVLALGSREPIDLPLARLDRRGETAHLTATDLALTPEETQQALGRRLGTEMATRVAGRLQALTEGWPTGFEICCQALSDAPTDQVDNILARLEKVEGRWFELFSAEVLSELDPELRRFLLETSVLPHLEADLCDELLKRTDSAQRLRTLASRGLFIAEVGDRSWRSHNLLRRCLRRNLSSETTPSRLRKLERRAAALMAGRGEPEAAALELVRHGDGAGAVALLARHARALMATRRPETLSLALAELPPADVESSGPLLLIRAVLADLRGDWDNAEDDLKRALRRRPSARLIGAIRARQVRLHLQRGHFSQCLSAGKRALNGTPKPVGGDQGLILASLAVAAASLGRLDQGESFLRDARKLARRLGNPELEGRCLFLAAANIHYVRGDLEAALGDASRARDLFHESGRPDLACHAAGVLGFVLAGYGRLGDARDASVWALQRAESIGYRLIAGYARLTLGMCDLLAADPVSATSRFDQALGIARELGEAALETWTRLGLAEAAWRRELIDQARTEAELALDLATRQKEEFCRARALAHLGRIAEHAQPGAGQSSWREAEKIFVRLDATLEHDRLRLWGAIAGGQDAVEVQAAIAAHGHTELLDKLEPAAPALAAATVGPPPGTQMDVSPLRIRLLGPLQIDRGGVPLPAGAWRSRRARRLFNLLVLRRARTLPREIAMEAMWPDTSPRKASLNLRQAVYQLRRILEEENHDVPSYILADGDSLRLELGAGGSCDLEDFDAALQLAQRSRRDGDQDAELEYLQQAADLWRAPLLADSPYDPEVDETGSAVRYRYLRAMGRRLELHAAQDQWNDVVEQARRALIEDPLRESFAQHLLRGLTQLGQLLDAREEYARFETRYLKELDLLPSGSLKELAERAVRAS